MPTLKEPLVATRSAMKRVIDLAGAGGIGKRLKTDGRVVTTERLSGDREIRKANGDVSKGRITDSRVGASGTTGFAQRPGGS